MNTDIRVLTVMHLGETEEENARITFSPMNVKMLAALDDTRQGRPVKKVSVLFIEGDNTEIFISEIDLLTFERAVGMYENLY